MSEHGNELRRQLDDDDRGAGTTTQQRDDDDRGAGTTSQQRDDERLSTADMAAGAGSERRQRDDEPAAAGPGDDDDRPAPLFPRERADEYRSHWRSVQTNFVDDPRNAVEDADALVARVMKELAETFAQERSQLENQWARGDDVSTEDLRVALRRYRSFFDRLLEI